MKVPCIIGADLSKKTIDVASHPNGQCLKITNDSEGFYRFKAWVKDQYQDLSQVKMVMEHTGAYSYRFEQFLHQQQISFSKVPGLAIKKSMGMVRGKSDKQDSIRIARYGYEKMDQLTSVEPLSAAIQRLQQLHSLREKLVANRASLRTAVKEMQFVYACSKKDLLLATQLDLIKCYDKQVTKLEQQIQAELKSEDAIEQNYELLQSIKGVGKVLAVAAIVKTNNFTKFPNARKFACFCGTAPFENSSGTSIRKRTKVSHMADKKMKTLLDLAAKCAIRYDDELRQYYVRRVESGKSKMSTINVVRNKILYRMFAVIKRQTPFYKLETKEILIQP
jgi:transposase